MPSKLNLDDRIMGGLIGAGKGLACIPADWRAYVPARNRWLRLVEKGQALVALIHRRATLLGRQLSSLSAYRGGVHA